jgi:NAD(P)-dependent dehydrogenase (short-subunit alcohol dehydrogenase family)
MENYKAMSNPVCLIVGAGDYIGAAIARRFAAGGYTVCLGRRNGEKSAALVKEICDSGGKAHGFTLDAREETQIEERFAMIENDIGPLEVVISNPGGNVNFPIRETTERVFYKVWKMACLTGFLTGREAAKYMLPRNVAHLIIDAGVDTAFVKERFEARGINTDELPEDTLMNPKSVGEAYWMLHNQTRDAWTQEMDLRPFAEKF